MIAFLALRAFLQFLIDRQVFSNQPEATVYQGGNK
jgi:hypothetical protein